MNKSFINIHRLATGLRLTGIKVKISHAISAIETELLPFLDENSKTRICGIQYDVFGFSRGAATARYFANIVADVVNTSEMRGANNPLTKMLTKTLSGKISRHWQGATHGQVRFLGLFDTVAGLCSPANLFDAGDGNTFDIDIKIRQKSALCGLHIQAANEYRYNFSLNAVPDFFPNLMMPGSHSDIGGGYPNHVLEENLYITQVYRKNNLRFMEKPQLEEKLQPALERFQQHPDLCYLFDGISKDNFYLWQEPVRSRDSSTNYNAFGVIRVTRQVQFGLDRIALRAMYDEAVKQGCQFALFLDTYAVPDELAIIAAKILSSAKQYHAYQLSDSEKQLVLGHYAHCSAEYERFFYAREAEIEVLDPETGEIKKIPWRMLIEKEHADTKLIKVHAPRLNAQGDWQRLIQPN